MSTPEKFTQFVQMAGGLFDYEDFMELDVEPQDIIADEIGFASTDIVRDETNEVFRFCVFNRPLNLVNDLPLFFSLYRDLENEDDSDEFDGGVLLARGIEDNEFWYVYRTESEELALFHSDYSIDEVEDEDDEEEDDEGEDADDDQSADKSANQSGGQHLA